MLCQNPCHCQCDNENSSSQMILVLRVESKYKNKKGLFTNNNQKPIPTNNNQILIPTNSNKLINANVASQPKFMQGNKNNMFRFNNKYDQLFDQNLINYQVQQINEIQYNELIQIQQVKCPRIQQKQKQYNLKCENNQIIYDDHLLKSVLKQKDINIVIQQTQRKTLKKVKPQKQLNSLLNNQQTTKRTKKRKSIINQNLINQQSLLSTKGNSPKRQQDLTNQVQQIQINILTSQTLLLKRQLMELENQERKLLGQKGEEERQFQMRYRQNVRKKKEISTKLHQRYRDLKQLKQLIKTCKLHSYYQLNQY